MLVQFVRWDTTICETPGKVTGQSGAVADDIALLPIKRPTSQSTVSVVNFFLPFTKLYSEVIDLPLDLFI